MANCVVKDLSHKVLVTILENHVIIKNDKSLAVKRRPGKISITIPDANKYLPLWVSKVMWRALPDFVNGNKSTILDIEVMRPGVVRLQGVFVAKDSAFVITNSKIYVLRPEIGGPVALVGQGESTIIKVSGPITTAVFQL